MNIIYPYELKIEVMQYNFEEDLLQFHSKVKKKILAKREKMFNRNLKILSLCLNTQLKQDKIAS